MKDQEKGATRTGCPKRGILPAECDVDKQQGHYPARVRKTPLSLLNILPSPHPPPRVASDKDTQKKLIVVEAFDLMPATFSLWFLSTRAFAAYIHSKQPSEAGIPTILPRFLPSEPTRLLFIAPLSFLEIT
ncbi:hypothetical protein MIND_00001700 [Mycena indigotica]|uniref:Uncharacterized protein n=1 Tax=Mycena indigotica TaxID=2126181 RepID=A0A8H6TCD4_9AGAR|nr:uncharacterized protein MIND_00001700 [Mycena indigotica]KAF7314880.1 hypothetical protein MIND_00001700 [Mycena indigotica]